MAIDYNFAPLEYNPYQFESTVGSQPVWTGEDWVRDGKSINWDSNRQSDYVARREQEKHQQYQDYAGEQFKGLFDMATANQQINPLQGFSQAPMYSPLNRSNYESDNAFQDARFGNINSYLGSLGSFLGNMGGGDAGIAQAAAQRAAHRASMPTIGMSQPMGTPQPMGMPQMGGSPALSGFGGGGGRLVG